MNKKFLMFGLPILAIALVSAVVMYYAVFSVTVNVTNPISIDGNDNVEVPVCESEDTCLSDNPITISNSGDKTRTVNIVDVSVDDNEGIIVNYVGKMLFTHKNLQTGELLGNTEEVIYSVTGETFVATGIPEGYKLIYYPDMDGRFTENVQNILVYGEDTFPSLPVVEDIGDDYCNIEILNGGSKANPTALVCNGAKLWLVDADYVDALQTGVWDTSKILFETDLITYMVSSTGEISIPADSTITFYPAFTPNNYVESGSYEFQFEIQ